MTLKECIELNKADLHVHLNGLFDTNTIKKVIVDEHLEIPKGFDIDKDLNVLSYKKTLLNYLKPWDILRLIPSKQDNLQILIKSAFEKLKQDNIKFIELRSTVIYLSLLFQKNLVDSLAILLQELTSASISFEIPYGLILTIPRGEYSLVYISQLLQAYDNLGRPSEIVGLDLAGNEDITVSSDLALKFKSAKHDFGLNITIHAGETGNFKNIEEAILKYGADRIGHGTAAEQSPQIMDLLVKKDICVEICPISNRRTGAVKAKEAHPVKTFIKNNVPFVICSDNPSIHNSSLTYDYLDFIKETNRHDLVKNMFEMQKKYTFIKNYGN